MTNREKLIDNMGKLLFGGHCSANYNHVRKMAKQLKEMDAKGQVKEAKNG